jgi:hypothetical protein
MLHSKIINSLPSGSNSINLHGRDDLVYKTCLMLFLIGFSTMGFGSFLFGIEFPTNITTCIIYLIFFIQLLTGSLQFSKFLFFIWLYIFIQTFVLNWSYINFRSSLIHFIGFVLFSLVNFSFFSKYRHKISSIIQTYYKFCLFIAYLAIFQFFLFLIFDISFIPQNILSGSLVFQGKSAFFPEVLGIFPRAVGLSTEPAHYIAILLPSVYISIYSLLGNKRLFNISNKFNSRIIIFGFIISFSLVGYLGLILCLVMVLRNSIKKSILKTRILILSFFGLIYFILQTSIGDKLYSFISVSKDITGTVYTTSDLSGFALLSNLLVALEGLKFSNFLGTGLNSHAISYDTFISKFFYNSQILMELNKENAASMFIRITSELGLPGLIMFIWILIYYKVNIKTFYSSYSVINNMCLIFLITFCLRNGNYLNILLFFFFAMYYYTYLVSKKDEKINEKK